MNIESLVTTAKIANLVLRKRAFAETLVPQCRNHVVAEVYSPDGVLKQTAEGWNSRVDAGASWQAGAMGGAATTPAIYVALAATAVTITKTDTYIGGTTSALELAANGCARALGTYTYAGAPATLGGTTSYTITKTFTCTTAPQAVGSVSLQYASSGANIFVEAQLSTLASLAINDTLAITYTVNI